MLHSNHLPNGKVLVNKEMCPLKFTCRQVNLCKFRTMYLNIWMPSLFTLQHEALAQSPDFHANNTFKHCIHKHLSANSIMWPAFTLHKSPFFIVTVSVCF